MAKSSKIDAVRNILGIYGQLLAIGLVAILYFSMFTAYVNGGQALLDVNKYNEGFWEVFLVMPLSLSIIGYSALRSFKRRL